MKTLILGTSHVGAIRLGWSQTPPGLRPDCDFFGYPVPAAALAGLLPDGRFGLREGASVTARMRAHLETVNGRASVDLADYERVVHVGHNPGLAQLTQLLAGVGVQGLRPAPGPDAAVISRPALRAFARRFAEESFPHDLLQTFAGKRLALVPLPRRAERLADLPEPKGDLARSLRAAPQGLVAALLQGQAEIVCVYAERGVTLIPQPPQTLGDFGLTRDVFNQGAVSLGMAAADFAHMNGDYGRLVLDRIEEWIATPAGGSPTP